MKYLILGINGMAGHMIAQYLAERGHQIIGFGRQKSHICETILDDACDKTAVKSAVNFTDADYIVNAIGVLNRGVDQNLAEGIYINSVLPHFLAQLVEGKKAKLIHISTDCVFEGTKGKYTEEDTPDAVSYYGRSKALGEVLDEKNLTIRTSIVGPEQKKHGIGLFHWFMSQKREICGYSNVIWSGVTTLQLAKAIEEDLHHRQTGLYHLVNNQFITKYELLWLFNQYCRKNDPILIKKDTSRICDKSLVNTKASPCFEIPDYEQMILEMAEWIRSHADLYAQYLGQERQK